jgi:hypothetical protein
MKVEFEVLPAKSWIRVISIPVTSLLHQKLTAGAPLREEHEAWKHIYKVNDALATAAGTRR